MKLSPMRRTAIALGIVVVAVFLGGWLLMLRMPRSSHRGSLDSLTDAHQRALKDLKEDVDELANGIGERHANRGKALADAEDWVRQSFMEAGYDYPKEDFVYLSDSNVKNLWVEIKGGQSAGEIVVIGAHYDTVPGSPGANDNASGVAAMLHLARAFKDSRPARTLRFVAFVNQEQPWFDTDRMGSRTYVRHLRERGEKVYAMLCMETMGCYSDQPGSQKYPPGMGLLYPSKGNFVAFIGNLASSTLTRRVVEVFRLNARFPSEGAVLPGVLPGITWSDHSSFWRAGFPAVMVTDTAAYRYPWHHAPQDTPDKLDFERLARVVVGLEAVVEDLAGAKRTAR